jgi:sugar phosphate permease
VLIFLGLTVAGIVAYFMSAGSSAAVFYGICTFLGFASGYWAIFVTIAAEQFGTNLRATVATTIPNFVRGMVVPITMLFQLLRKDLGIQQGALLVGGICMAVALVSLWRLQETFHKDLDYFEEYL